MSLGIPPRRVSPRSRRRYKAIRNFFRKTLGSLTSHSGIRINSSIAVNVTDLKRKVVGIKRYQNEVAQSYRDENLSRREIDDTITTEENIPSRSPKFHRRQSADRDVEESETRVLYTTPNNLHENSQDFISKLFNELSDRGQHSSDGMNNEQYAPCERVPKRKSKKTKYDNFRKHKSQAIVENSVSYIGSFESLDLPILRSHRAQPDSNHFYNNQQDFNRHLQPDEAQGTKRKSKANRYKSQSPSIAEERRKKNKHKSPPARDDTNQNFITDIINRQYRPVSLFGRRASDFSRMSTPVCRDQRYSARELTIADSEVSTSYREPVTPRRCRPCVGVSRMRSVCDTRLYSAAPTRPPRRDRRRLDDYNDSNLYDVIPVKEKSSPKSRRKFIEDNTIMNEVPPSPRTQRPRLNLDTRHYSDCEDYEERQKLSRRRQSPYRRWRPEYTDGLRHEMSSEESQNGDNEINPKYVMRTKNTTRLHDDIGTTMSSQHYLAFPNKPTNVTLDKSKPQDKDDKVPADKTDRALSEIKDILQSFLHELKKDSSTSHSDQTNDSSNKNSGKELFGTPRGSGNDTSNAMKSSAASSFNSGLGLTGVPTIPPQFIAGYANPCCYPAMVPMYGAHAVPCLHNSCIRASPSCLCAAVGCGHNHRATTDDAPCHTCSKVNCTAEENEPKKECETDELIREIYNYVARNSPVNKKEESNNSPDRFEQGRSTVPGVRKSMHTIRLDANVGTSQLRCYSKSCEAIASRQQLEYPPYPCYSESLLEKLSQEAMDYEMPPCETNEYKMVNKKKPSNASKQQPQSNKFINVLRHIRKNMNRKEVHEVCHSEQSIEVDVIPKPRQYFNQEFATYAMHGQEYFHPPPAPPVRRVPRPPPRFDYDYPSYDPRMPEYPRPGPVSDRYDPRYDYMPPQAPDPMYDPQYPCEPPYRGNQPQVPLCLKEVEVRSVATQSVVKKAPYFRVFSQMKKSSQQLPQSPPAVQPPIVILRQDHDRPAPYITPTLSDSDKPEKPRKLFNFNLQPPARKPVPKPSLSEKIQKDITKNDASTDLIKKLFHKRNPFSPQNTFVRTIMEKDNTVYKWRPRLFV